MADYKEKINKIDSYKFVFEANNINMINSTE